MLFLTANKVCRYFGALGFLVNIKIRQTVANMKFNGFFLILVSTSFKHMGFHIAPISWGVFDNFCVLTCSYLTFEVTFNCKLQDRAAGCITCSPNNCVGEQLEAPAAPQVPAPMQHCVAD